MVCTLIEKNGTKNWCERHGAHDGHYADYAVDPGEKGERFRRLWDAMKAGSHEPPIRAIPKPRLRSLQMAKGCKHLGPEVGDVKPGCGPCGKKYVCDKRGETKLHTCTHECTDFETKPKVLTEREKWPKALIDALASKTPQPEKPVLPASFSWDPIRFDERNLAPGTGGVRANPSIIDYKDGYLFAYRNSWGAANISVIRLDKNFLPIGQPKQLNLSHEQAAHGKEDPRLFWHKGKIHVWYTGWMGGDTPRRPRPRWIASVLFARLDNDTLEVEDKFFPNIPRRHRWEKNHSYFDLNDETYCVYSIVPHRVLKVFCEEVQEVYETPTVTSWPYRHLRGGASPVFHKGEYYHFFHGMQEANHVRLYSIGVATFEAKPPFRITRITNEPLTIADKNPDPRRHSVIFPGGAVFVDGRWVVACGIHDAWSEIRFFSEKEVEDALELTP